VWQPIFADIGAIIIAGVSLARVATPLVPLDRLPSRGMIEGV